MGLYACSCAYEVLVKETDFQSLGAEKTKTFRRASKFE